MFEYHGQPYEKISIEQAEWGQLKGKPGAGEFNSLPLVEIKGSRGHTRELGQLSAVLRCFGIRFGYYNPRDWMQARLIDPIIDTWTEVVQA